MALSVPFEVTCLLNIFFTQASRRAEDGSQGYQSMDSGAHEHYPTYRIELFKLLPYVSSTNVTFLQTWLSDILLRLTATLGFNTTITLLLAA